MLFIKDTNLHCYILNFRDNTFYINIKGDRANGGTGRRVGLKIQW